MKIMRREANTGGFIWYKDSDSNYWHREDGPARIFDNGEEYWFYYNKEYYNPKDMPLNLFLAYCRWEYNKNGK